MKTAPKQRPDMINIAIDMKKLEALFADGQLCVADVQCLDDQAKAYIWHMCLSVCAKGMRCSESGEVMGQADRERQHPMHYYAEKLAIIDR